MLEFIFGLIVGIFFGSGLILWGVALGIDSEKVQKKIKENLLREKTQFIEPIDKSKLWLESDNINDILDV